MEKFGVIDIFATLFVVMGPFKVVLVYAELTAQMESAMRRRIAIQAVIVAFIIGLLFILGGGFLMNLFHFSVGALNIAGGIILFLFAANMVLSGGGENHYGDVKDPTSIAIYPLAMPLMASPIGIVVLTTISATRSVTNEALLGVILVLLAVMIINLVILLLEGMILKYISPQAIGLAERVLGILLAALAVQTILNGAAELGIITLKGAGHG